MKYLKLAALALLAACSRQAITEYTDVDALRASLVYNRDSVQVYRKAFGETNKAIAASYLEKGQAEEAQNPERAAYFYKRAITLQPEEATYKKLAAVLWNLKRYEELNELYSFLIYPIFVTGPGGALTGENIFSKPDEDLFYEYLAASYLQWHRLPAEEFYGSEESGYNLERLKERFKNDKRLGHDTSSFQFKTAMLQFLAQKDLEAIARQPGMFAGFIASIKDTSSSFGIGENNVPQFNYEDFNGVSFDGDYMQLSFHSVYVCYLQEKQEKKDSWYNYNFNHAPRLPGGFHTVVYAIDTSETACPREMRHVYHRLATYNSEGSVIDSKVVACQAGEELSTFQMNGPKFSVTRFKRNWKKPYKKSDFDNEVTSISRLDESLYEIGSDGKIKEASPAEISAL